jgi:hypothetical protein
MVGVWILMDGMKRPCWIPVEDDWIIFRVFGLKGIERSSQERSLKQCLVQKNILKLGEIPSGLPMNRGVPILLSSTDREMTEYNVEYSALQYNI